MNRNDLLALIQLNFEKRIELSSKIDEIRGRYHINDLDRKRLIGLMSKRDELWDEQQEFIKQFKGEHNETEALHKGCGD